MSDNKNEVNVSTRFFVEKASFTNNFKNGNFKLNPVISKRIRKIDDKNYDVSLKIIIKNSEENEFPLDLELVVTLRSIFKDNVFEEKVLDEYLNSTCLSALYPYLRSSVSNLCTACLINPIILPIADISQILEEEK